MDGTLLGRLTLFDRFDRREDILMDILWSHNFVYAILLQES